VINATYNVLAQHMLSKDGADPLVFSVYRDLAAAPILHLIALGMEGQKMPAKEDAPRIILQGFLGVFCNQVLFLVGVQMTDATVASIVNLTLPVFAALLAIGLGMESFQWATAGGLLLAVSGAIFMQALGAKQPVRFSTGVLVIAAGALASALYFIIQKGSLAKYPPITMTAWEYWIGFGFMGLSAAIFVEHGDRWMLSPNAMFALVFSVIFNSVIKYALNTICNKHVSVIILTVWATLVPVLTAVLSAIFLGMPLLELRYLGALPITLGTFLVTKGRMDSQRKRESSMEA